MTERQAPPAGGGSIPAPSLQVYPDIIFETCSARDSRREQARRKHYVPIKGTHGQQIHFLIWYKEQLVGAISGASAVYASGPRDKFFGITAQNRQRVLNGIVDNVYFRLEVCIPNLASQILASWRRVVAHVWEDLYGIKVFGFETFADKEREDGTQNRRFGTIYKADNWTLAGETSGNAKFHGRGGLTGGVDKKQPHRRHETQSKFTLCKWVPPHNIPVESEYKSSWRANTSGGTSAEKLRAKSLSKKRRWYLGKFIYTWGNKISIKELKINGTAERE